MGMNQSLISTLILILLVLTPCIRTQQQYSGNSALDCNTSSASLYTCNGKLMSCRAFLIFRARFPYNTVPAIAALLSSNTSEIARLNDASKLAAFPADKEVVVPVTCSCSGQYYEAKTYYQIPTSVETYFVIANSTYQGLSTCKSLEGENRYGEFSLRPGLELQVPLRCACPTKEQAGNGTKYLLTYSVDWKDTIHEVGERFKANTREIVEGNGFSFSGDNPTLFPFTTILIPLSREPFITSPSYKPPISPPPQPKPNLSRRKSKKGVLIGSGVAGGLFMLILILVFSFMYPFQRRKKGEDILVEIARIDRIRSLEHYKFKDLKKGTGGFSSRNRIKGSSMYRGVLKGGEVVAIKKTSIDASEEIKMLNTINHVNLVKLHGFSTHQGCYYLVFEYMKNGSLREWLNKKVAEGSREGCIQKIQIAIDVANGLHYLHSFTKPGYIHKNICSRNIVLDCNLRAKIANFSFARTLESPMTRKIIGTRGYVAPEYLERASVTPKIDVYAFGVVLLEIISGKCAVFVHEGRETLLSAAVVSTLSGENAETAVAGFIEADVGQGDGIEYALQIAKLAVRCLARDPSDRPNMAELLPVLLKIHANLQKTQQQLQQLV